MTTVLSYDYAKEALEKIEGSTAAIVAGAFKRVLERKVAGQNSDEVSLPTNPTDAQRFEFFFSELFEVGPDPAPLPNEEVRAAIVAARDFLLEDAERCKRSRKDRDLESMKREDAQAYEDMLSLFDGGYYGAARIRYWNQDTAARDYMFMGRDTIANRKLWHRLNQWLNADRGD
jgi:hypothetical protein